MSARDLLLLDYDHTLYPPVDGSLRALDERITQFVVERLGCGPKRAKTLRRRYNRLYGTTLQGLRLRHGIAPMDYFDYIHRVEAASLPRPNPAVRRWLLSQRLPMYLFTNARADWVALGLASMGLASGDGPRFEGIFDLQFLGWRGKPHADAFRRVEEHLQARHGPVRIFYADDSPENLWTAHKRRWHSVWIHPTATERLPFEGPYPALQDWCGPKSAASP